jgi:hypothetical protein
VYEVWTIHWSLLIFKNYMKTGLSRPGLEEGEGLSERNLYTTMRLEGLLGGSAGNGSLGTVVAVVSIVGLAVGTYTRRPLTFFAISSAWGSRASNKKEIVY